jgi:hypothetical protein
MGEHKPWQEKFRMLLHDAGLWTQPIEVKPKGVRRSGPMETPSDWWTDEGQRRVAPECGQCRDRSCGSCPKRPKDDAA